MSPNLSPRQIIAAMCEGTGITPDEVLGKSRFREVSELRHRSMQQVHGQLGWCKARIARAFGVNHSSVHYALRKSGE